MAVYRLLGPLEVVSDGSVVALGNGTQRELFALLLVDANRRVSVERLIDSLWEEPPASAGKIIQNCIVRLRRALPDGVLLTHGHAYELRVDPTETDLGQFRELVERSRAATGANEPADAARLLAEALAVWRGPALADTRQSAALRAEAERLDELHLAALGDRIDADLQSGRHENVIEELKRLVASHPLRERLQAQLMLALYRSGRQAEALDSYRLGRAKLVDQLGVEPGPALRQLEQAMLRHDPAIAAPAASAPGGYAVSIARRSPRKALLVAAVIAAMAAAIAFAVVSQRSSSGAPPSAGQLITVNPATGRVSAHLAIGSSAVGIAFAAGRAFVLNQLGTVETINARTLVIEPGEIAVTSNNLPDSTSIAAIDGAAWTVDSYDGTLTRIGPVDAYAHASLLHDVSGGDDYITLTSGDGMLWATSDVRREVIAFDPATARVAWQTRVPGQPIAATTGAGAVWCISGSDTGSLLSRINPRTHLVVAPIDLPGPASSITFGLGSVWIAIPASGIVLRVDPGTNSIERTFQIGNLPTAVAVTAGRLWVATAADDDLLSLDPATGREESRTRLGRLPHMLAAAAGRIWIVTS